MDSEHLILTGKVMNKKHLILMGMVFNNECLVLMQEVMNDKLSLFLGVLFFNFGGSLANSVLIKMTFFNIRIKFAA